MGAAACLLDPGNRQRQRATPELPCGIPAIAAETLAWRADQSPRWLSDDQR